MKAEIFKSDTVQLIIKNTSWLLADKVLRISVGLLLAIYMARFLGPESYGQLSFGMAFVSMFSAVSTLGLHGIIVRDIVYEPDQERVILGTAIAIQFLGGVCGYALLAISICWLNASENTVKALVMVLGLSMLFNHADVAVCWFESRLQSNYVVWVQSPAFFICGIIKGVLIVNHSEVIYFAWVAVAETLVTSVLIYKLFFRYGLDFKKLKLKWNRAMQLISDGWPMMLSAIAIIVYMRIDQIMLEGMLGSDAVGVFSVAVRASEVWYFIPTLIVASVFPSILAAKQINEKKYQNAMQKLYDSMVLISVVIAVPVSLFSTQIIDILFGKEYIESADVLKIHIWASVFVFIGVASGKWFQAENLLKVNLYRTVLGAFVNVVLNMILIPKIGVKGAAVSTVVAHASAAFLFDLFSPTTREMFVMKVRSMNFLRYAKCFR